MTSLLLARPALPSLPVLASELQWSITRVHAGAASMLIQPAGIEPG